MSFNNDGGISYLKIRTALTLVLIILLSAPVIAALPDKSVPAAARAVYMWYYLPHERGRQPEPMEKARYLKEYIKNRDVYYVGSADENAIYLTFDDCPGNGNIPALLDILDRHSAPAAFFMTAEYIEKNPDVIRRIVSGGRLVCNHTANHVSVTRLSGAGLLRELKGVEDAYRSVTGTELPKYFRPPQGCFDESTLKLTREAGYVTVFWSFEYGDWDANNRPSEQLAYETVIKATHPGEIALFHCQSDINVKILDRVLTEWEREGYSFKSLDHLTGRD